MFVKNNLKKAKHSGLLLFALISLESVTFNY